MSSVSVGFEEKLAELLKIWKHCLALSCVMQTNKCIQFHFSILKLPSIRLLIVICSFFFRDLPRNVFIVPGKNVWRRSNGGTLQFYYGFVHFRFYFIHWKINELVQSASLAFIPLHHTIYHCRDDASTIFLRKIFES